jgi:putative transposase
MLLVERHQIKGTPEIVRLCQTSKELYNKCNYYMRQRWFGNLKNDNWVVPLPDLMTLTALVHEEESFKNLHNTKTAKQTIRKCLSDWSNFRKALNAWKKDPSKFERRPEPPYYKNKMAQVIFYNETIKGGQSGKPLDIITPTNCCFSIKSSRKFRQVIITPKRFGFVIDVQYEHQLPNKSKAKGTCCTDIGLNNLCAITSDQHLPILINGSILKSVNQWYNKHPSRKNGKKRYWRIENYFHHVSKLIVANCVRFGVSTIIIGKNDGWKQAMKMRKDTKQNFQFVPFYNLLQKIVYKAAMVGIKVIFTEEAYTSKASFLDRDPLPVYAEGVEPPQFSGKRVKRGLYRAADGRLLNADINGSANIGRKVIGDSEFFTKLDRSVAATPIRINPLNLSA